MAPAALAGHSVGEPSKGRISIGAALWILSMLRDPDKVGQIQALSEFLRANFDVRGN